MAFNPSPKVADCRDICEKWGNGTEQVIIIGIDGEGAFTAVSYGKTAKDCKFAEMLARCAMDGIIQKLTEVQAQMAARN